MTRVKPGHFGGHSDPEDEISVPPTQAFARLGLSNPDRAENYYPEGAPTASRHSSLPRELSGVGSWVPPPQHRSTSAELGHHILTENEKADRRTRNRAAMKDPEAFISELLNVARLRELTSDQATGLINYLTAAANERDIREIGRIAQTHRPWQMMNPIANVIYRACPALEKFHRNPWSDPEFWLHADIIVPDDENDLRNYENDAHGWLGRRTSVPAVDEAYPPDYNNMPSGLLTRRVVRDDGSRGPVVDMDFFSNIFEQECQARGFTRAETRQALAFIIEHASGHEMVQINTLFAEGRHHQGMNRIENIVLGHCRQLREQNYRIWKEPELWLNGGGSGRSRDEDSHQYHDDSQSGKLVPTLYRYHEKKRSGSPTYPRASYNFMF